MTVSSEGYYYWHHPLGGILHVHAPHCFSHYSVYKKIFLLLLLRKCFVNHLLSSSIPPPAYSKLVTVDSCDPARVGEYASFCLSLGLVVFRYVMQSVFFKDTQRTVPLAISDPSPFSSIVNRNLVSRNWSPLNRSLEPYYHHCHPSLLQLHKPPTHDHHLWKNVRTSATDWMDDTKQCWVCLFLHNIYLIDLRIAYRFVHLMFPTLTNLFQCQFWCFSHTCKNILKKLLEN